MAVGKLRSGGAISTIGYHVSRALDFYKKNDVYFALAKETEWGVDPIPEPTSDSTLDSPWGYKKVEAKYIVVPDEHGTISYQNTKWRIVQPEDAVRENARWCYITSFIYYDELPFKTYHQVGVLTGLVKNEGVPSGKMNLLPSEVQNQGILEIIDFRPGIGRAPDMREQIGLIIEF